MWQNTEQTKRVYLNMDTTAIHLLLLPEQRLYLENLFLDAPAQRIHFHSLWATHVRSNQQPEPSMNIETPEADVVPEFESVKVCKPAATSAIEGMLVELMGIERSP